VVVCIASSSRRGRIPLCHHFNCGHSCLLDIIGSSLPEQGRYVYLVERLRPARQAYPALQVCRNNDEEIAALCAITAVRQCFEFGVYASMSKAPLQLCLDAILGLPANGSKRLGNRQSSPFQTSARDPPKTPRWWRLNGS